MWAQLQQHAAVWQAHGRTFSTDSTHSQAKHSSSSSSSKASLQAERSSSSKASGGLTEHEREHLRSALLGKVQQDPNGLLDLLLRSLDTHSQRELLVGLEERPALSRQYLTPEVIPVQEEGPPAPPRMSQLAAVAFTKGLPFVAFGFFDNIIMITAGEQIDLLFGAKLGLSSMAAAGLGNTVADVVGINISHSIESRFKRAKGFAPKLTKAQWVMPITRRAKWLGCAVGMATGCLLGLTPLLFFPSSKDGARDPPPSGGDEKK